jgi:sugar/nucleoside kinase (ribokinase family)
MPCDAQIRLTHFLREKCAVSLFVSIADSEMFPKNSGRIRLLLHGVDICYCTEEAARRLFDLPIGPLRDLSVRLASLGPPVVLIGKKHEGFGVYDSTSGRHVFLPAYSASVLNPLGFSHAFCGGFLAGWKTTFHPLEAGLQGIVSSSLAAEGPGAFHVLECHPLLAKSRFDSLRRCLYRDEIAP